MTHSDIFEDKNNFSKSDIQNISELLFDFFKCDDDEAELMSEKVEVINLFIETLHKALYSNLVKTDAQKIIILKTITKLKMQQEILELLQSEDVEEAVKNLKAAAERMGKKSQSSVRTST